MMAAIRGGSPVGWGAGVRGGDGLVGRPRTGGVLMAGADTRTGLVAVGVRKATLDQPDYYPNPVFCDQVAVRLAGQKDLPGGAVGAGTCRRRRSYGRHAGRVFPGSGSD